MNWCGRFWVYQQTREDIAADVRRLINASNVVVNRGAAEAGLAMLDDGGDFADGVIAHEGRALGADCLVSFDKQAVNLLTARGEAVRLLTNGASPEARPQPLTGHGRAVAPIPPRKSGRLSIATVVLCASAKQGYINRTVQACEPEGYGTDPLFTGLAILPYGIGLFVGPLVTAPLARLRPWLLTIGMAIQVAGYAGVAAVIVAGYDGWPVVLAVLLAGFGQGIAYPRLFNTTLGDVPPHQAGVAAGVLASALQIGAAISVAGIGSLFFAVLDGGSGRDAYAHAFGIAQAATTAALVIAKLLSVPRRVP